MLQLAMHAAWADGIVQTQEGDAIRQTALALQANIPPMDAPGQLASIADLAAKVQSREEKVRTLDFVVHIVASDGCLDEAEEAFLKDFWMYLAIRDSADADSEAKKLVEEARAFAAQEKRWRTYMDSL